MGKFLTAAVLPRMTVRLGRARNARWARWGRWPSWTGWGRLRWAALLLAREPRPLWPGGRGAFALGRTRGGPGERKGALGLGAGMAWRARVTERPRRGRGAGWAGQVASSPRGRGEGREARVGQKEKELGHAAGLAGRAGGEGRDCWIFLLPILIAFPFFKLMHNPQFEKKAHQVHYQTERLYSGRMQQPKFL
jgi:hypothetical protein